MFFPPKGTILAPMRALTQAPFWKLLHHYGAPDAYVSEFIRVHENFSIDAQWIEEALTCAGHCPLWIQLMGNNVHALAKNVQILQKYPIAGIDFNAGCPVPKIYKKQAGGGLLRNLPLFKELLYALRLNCQIPLSIKLRLGFDSTNQWEALLDVLEASQVDLITIHARTVKDLYTGHPRYECIKYAVKKCSIPIIANGDICNLAQINHVLNFTQCRGVMLGRAAISNPWVFSQWRNTLTGQQMPYPRFKDVFEYLKKIDESFLFSQSNINVGCLKRFCKYICPAIDKDGIFLKQVNICSSWLEFWSLCEKWLLIGPQGEKLFTGS